MKLVTGFREWSIDECNHAELRTYDYVIAP